MAFCHVAEFCSSLVGPHGWLDQRLRAILCARARGRLVDADFWTTHPLSIISFDGLQPLQLASISTASSHLLLLFRVPRHCAVVSWTATRRESRRGGGRWTQAKFLCPADTLWAQRQFRVSMAALMCVKGPAMSISGLFCNRRLLRLSRDPREWSAKRCGKPSTVRFGAVDMSLQTGHVGTVRFLEKSELRVATPRRDSLCPQDRKSVSAG